jgi:8-oxo-dGTP pyrophosphatase MutT (NUDIX family)
MRFTDTIARLERGLAADLPGAVAQDLLAPIPRRQWPVGVGPDNARHAAGLLIVFPDHDDAHIVLTVRADSLGRHRGQVSLPGGVVDPGETYEQAALREAHEEIGLAADSVRVLGALTPIDIPVSGFRLHPIVAAASAVPALTPSDGEVARILYVPVAHLLDASRMRAVERTRDGVALLVPAFHIDGSEIWGATAMVLAEFLTLLDWTGPAAERS